MSGPSPDNVVKKETMLLVGFACLVIGFLGGIVFSIYKSPAGVAPGGVSQQQQSAPQGQAKLTQEQIQAMLALEREVAANPENVDAWTRLGHLYFDSDQYEKAIKAYNRSLSLAPENPDVWTDLGVMYRRNGQPDKAIASFDKAISVNPQHETARFNKGIVLLYDLNDPAGAIASWEGLLQINPAATAPNGKPVQEIVAELKANVQKNK